MLQSVDLCPNCNVVANSGLSKCAAGHTYCYNCACVIGDGDAAYMVSESSFCPLCAEPLKDIAPPDEYVCPITHELMVKPVVASDGFSYERSAIEDWVLHKRTSPKTNGLIQDMFFDNHNLRHAIEEWKLLNRL